MCRQGQFRFEGPSFPTIQELISYQHECGLAVTNKSGAVLRQAILRERWELNNDDVELLEKIGRVSGGADRRSGFTSGGADCC